MKIYNKLTVSMADWSVVEEDSFEYEGSLALAKGGGGGSSGSGSTSGKVDFPVEMKAYLNIMMSGGHIASGAYLDVPLNSGGSLISVYRAVNAAWDNSPYASAFPFDPTSYLNDTREQLRKFTDAVNEIDPVDFWDTFLQEAVSTVDGTFLSDDAIEAAVTAFESQQTATLATGKTRMRSGFADVNAVNGTAFVVADTILEDRFSVEISKFRADLFLQQQQQRTNAIQQSVQSMLALLQGKLGFLQAAASVEMESNRIAVVAQMERYNRDVDLAVKDALWNISLFQYPANILASIHGAAAVYKTAHNQDDHSSGHSAIGGGIGAIVGGIVGLPGGPAGVMAGAQIGGNLGSTVGGMF